MRITQNKLYWTPASGTASTIDISLGGGTTASSPNTTFDYIIANVAVGHSSADEPTLKKNYLFSQNDRGAEDNAVFYTFTVTCEILKVTPRQWLEYALENVRPDMDEEDLAKLLPYNYKDKAGLN